MILEITYKSLFDEIRLQSQNLGLNNQKTKEMIILIFYWSFVNSYDGKDKLKVFGNNPGLISIDQYWGTIGNQKYFCTTTTNIIPYVEFNSLTDYVVFLINRWKDRVPSNLSSQIIKVIGEITTNTPSVQEVGNLSAEIIKFCYTNSFSQSQSVGLESYNKMAKSSDLFTYASLLGTSFIITWTLIKDTNL